MEFAAAQQVEHRKKELKPTPDPIYAALILQRHWGLSSSRIKPIDSYDDFNFFVQGESAEGKDLKYLMKFFNGVESADAQLLAGYSAMMAHLGRHCPGLQFQSACLTNSGEDVVELTDCPVFSGEKGVRVAVRLLTWIDGITMSASGATLELLYREGIAVGKMSLALREFSHAGLERVQFWDGQHFLTHVSPFLRLVQLEDGLRSSVEAVLRTFERDVLPVASEFPWSCIMGDCNDANILVTDPGPSGPERDIRGFIDFGDAVHSWGVLELANALVSVKLGFFYSYQELKFAVYRRTACALK